MATAIRMASGPAIPTTATRPDNLLPESRVRACLARLDGDESVLVERAGCEAEFDRMARRAGLFGGPVYFGSRTEPLYAGGGRELWITEGHQLAVRGDMRCPRASGSPRRWRSLHGRRS